MGVPLWFDWQSPIFPREIRGRAIGSMAGASALDITVAALASGAVRRMIAFPLDYVLLIPFLGLVPLGTGWLMENAVGVRNGIALALVPSVVGILWLIFRVKEPRTLGVLAGNNQPAAS